MGDNESVNQIAMWYIDPPQIMVLDPHTQYYFWPPFGMEHANLLTVSEFLESVVNGTAPVYGGTGFFKRIQRVGWDVFTTMYVSTISLGTSRGKAQIFNTDNGEARKLALLLCCLAAFKQFLVCGSRASLDVPLLTPEKKS